MFRIGIVGTGAIGKQIARAIDNGVVPAKLEAIWDRDVAEANAFAATLKSRPRVVPLDELVGVSNFIVEAASQAAVKEVVLAALSNSRSVMIMSVGALADKGLLDEVRSMAREHACSVYVPSGAICGLDGVKAASVCKIDSVTITTRKPRDGLRGAPFIVKNRIDVDSITEPTEIFSGPASVAIKEFPANVNVAASLSLVGVGFERTRVRVVLDPLIKRNIHEIVVRGEFGELRTLVENVPARSNPKTSLLAALSAIATLRQVCEPFKIGT
ncbi:MAG TPA: aspartate dehydrogenase [Methanocella sp.]|nr:aspartate dehydrogenase [Methanocella sp.]